MHGILRLRDKIQGNAPDGWRERYDAMGTEEVLPEDSRPGREYQRPRAGDTAGA